MSCPLRSACARWLSRVLVFALLFCLVSGVRGETPQASDFPGLGAACRPIEKFVSGTTILVGKEGQAESPAAKPTGVLFAASSRIFAFEENARFLCAVGDASQMVQRLPDQTGDAAKPIVVRRLIVLQPSVFVIDELIVKPDADAPVKWWIHCEGKPDLEHSDIRLRVNDEHLLWQTLLPVLDESPKLADTPETSGNCVQMKLRGRENTQVVRCLHLLQLRSEADAGRLGTATYDYKNGNVELKITTPSGVYDIELPAPGTAAGRISLRATDGKTVVRPRPLPSGILPHGPEGMRLIERWDSRYRESRIAPWDTGVPAPALEKAVADGDVRPCRTVVLGCGSGTNAIYLAKKGFDVTAIDVAPTALAIAEEKANKAGVKVRWMLADVLALPELEPFDFIFDRGCYHNVRYVDVGAFMKSVGRLSKPGTQFLVLSLNRDGPPGVREQTMRDDFSPSFNFEWLREGGIRTGKSGQTLRQSWSLMLTRKSENSK